MLVHVSRWEISETSVAFLDIKVSVRADDALNKLIDSQELQTSQKEKSEKISFIIHPHKPYSHKHHLKNFKLLQNDPKTGTIVLHSPLISFKRD